MLKGLRFVAFGGVAVFVVAVNAPGLADAASSLAAPTAFFDEAPAMIAAAFVVAIVVSYAVWLAGATASGWRMPPWCHLPMVVVAGWSVVRGPVVRRAGSDPTLQADRAARALGKARDLLSGEPLRRCDDLAAGTEERLAAAVRREGPRYYARGRPVEPTVRRVGSASVVDPESRPGTLQVACDGRDVSMSFVVLGALPSGPAQLLPDATGQARVYSVGLRP